MRLVKTATGMAMVLSLTLAPLDAASNGPKGPSSVKTSSPKAPKVAKTTTPPKATKAPKVTTVAATGAPKAKAPKTTKVDTKLAKAETKAARKAGTTATTTTADTTSTVGTTTTLTTVDFTQGAVAEKLAKNTNLRTKLETRLLAAGYTGTAYQASYGFRNLGQFVAATNVAANHPGVSFELLKIQMTGLSVDANGVVLRANLAPDGTITMVDPLLVTTPAPTKSLGQALQTVKIVDPLATAQTATTQADAEIAATSGTN